MRVQGYNYFGLTRKGKSTVYREWAPAAAGAQLIGDFNDWHGTHMQRIEGGAWEVTIPDSECWAAGVLPLAGPSASPFAGVVCLLDQAARASCDCCGGVPVHGRWACRGRTWEATAPGKELQRSSGGTACCMCCSAAVSFVMTVQAHRAVSSLSGSAQPAPHVPARRSSPTRSKVSVPPFGTGPKPAVATSSKAPALLL